MHFTNLRGVPGANRPNSVNSVASLSQQQENQSEPYKRLQDSLAYKRAQKRELTDKLVQLEGDVSL